MPNLTTIWHEGAKSLTWMVNHRHSIEKHNYKGGVDWLSNPCPAALPSALNDMVDYCYDSHLSLAPMLIIGLGTRLDSPWTVAVESGKPVLSFSSVSPELLSKGVRLYTTHKRSVKTAEWCRLSWVHMPNSFTRLDESQAGSSCWAHSLAQ